MPFKHVVLHGTGVIARGGMLIEFSDVSLNPLDGRVP